MDTSRAAQIRNIFIITESSIVLGGVISDLTLRGRRVSGVMPGNGKLPVGRKIEKPGMCLLPSPSLLSHGCSYPRFSPSLSCGWEQLARTYTKMELPQGPGVRAFGSLLQLCQPLQCLQIANPNDVKCVHFPLRRKQLKHPDILHFLLGWWEAAIWIHQV